jgi:hypothetical protein
MSLVAVTLQDLEGLWFLSVLPFGSERAYGVRGHQADSWAPPLLADPPRPYDVPEGLPFPQVHRVDAGSLQVLLQVPWEAYATGAASFIGGAAMLFGAPMRAAAQWQQWRRQFWENRVAADDAKQSWLQQRRAWNEAAGVRLQLVESPPLPPVPATPAATAPEEIEPPVAEVDGEEEPPPMMLA